MLRNMLAFRHVGNNSWRVFGSERFTNVGGQEISLFRRLSTAVYSVGPSVMQESGSLAVVKPHAIWTSSQLVTSYYRAHEDTDHIICYRCRLSCVTSLLKTFFGLFSVSRSRGSSMFTSLSLAWLICLERARNSDARAMHIPHQHFTMFCCAHKRFAHLQTRL